MQEKKEMKKEIATQVAKEVKKELKTSIPSPIGPTKTVWISSRKRGVCPLIVPVNYVTNFHRCEYATETLAREAWDRRLAKAKSKIAESRAG